MQCLKSPHEVTVAERRSFQLDLQYPPPPSPCPPSPCAPPFPEVVAQSLSREEEMKGWCPSCRAFQPLSQVGPYSPPLPPYSPPPPSDLLSPLTALRGESPSACPKCWPSTAVWVGRESWPSTLGGRKEGKRGGIKGKTRGRRERKPHAPGFPPISPSPFPHILKKYKWNLSGIW